MQKSITWFTRTEDGKIDRIQPTRENEKPVPENLDWRKSAVTPIAREEKLDWYEEDAEGNIIRKLTNGEYLKKQKREDPRGEYYDKERKQPNKHVYDIDSLPPEGFTKIPPLEKEAFQNWNEKKQKWEVDTEKKQRSEKEQKLAELKSHAAALDIKALRPQREKDLGIDVEESEKRIRNIQIEIEKLRPEINALEEELKSA